MNLIVFRPVKDKVLGAGVHLEQLAQTANASFPCLWRLVQQLSIEDINEETQFIIQVMPEADVRMANGMAVPLAFAKKVSLSLVKHLYKSRNITTFFNTVTYLLNLNLFFYM